MSRILSRSFTARVLALCILFAACVTGCLSGTGDPPPPPDDPDGPDDIPKDSTGAPRAFFTLHATDIRSAAWPESYLQYSLFVCDPSLSADDIAEIRRVIPSVTLLAYSNVQDVPLGMYAGNPYYEALQAAFDSTLCAIDLATGKVIRQQGHVDGVPDSGTPHFVVREASADVLVAFHRDVTMLGDWDGIYIDQCTQLYPPWREAMFTDFSPVFDVTGDGVADSMATVEAQYLAWRPYFTSRLRAELGADVLLVANAGGVMGDPALHGITLEGTGSRFTVEQSRLYLLGQEAVGHAPFVAVLWATTPESVVPSGDLAEEIPGVYFGVIDPNG